MSFVVVREEEERGERGRSGLRVEVEEEEEKNKRKPPAFSLSLSSPPFFCCHSPFTPSFVRRTPRDAAHASDLQRRKRNDEARPLEGAVRGFLEKTSSQMPFAAKPCSSIRKKKKTNPLLFFNLLTPTPPSAPRSPSTPGACRRWRQRTLARGTAFRRTERKRKKIPTAAVMRRQKRRP